MRFKEGNWILNKMNNSKSDLYIGEFLRGINNGFNGYFK